MSFTKNPRQPLALDLRDRAHHDAEAVRELQALVHPGARVGGSSDGIDLPRGEHHLAPAVANVVAVDVDVVKVVVEADHLQLAVGVEQRPGIPQPDVRERRLVALDRRRVEPSRRRERLAAESRPARRRDGSGRCSSAR